MRILGVIPARFNSSRLPGKMLEDINGKTLIQWVYDSATQSKRLTDVVIATDSEKISEVAVDFGAKVVMTSDNHLSGTSRLTEVVKQYDDYDYYLNIQGDQPNVSYKALDLLCDKSIKSKAGISTLYSKVSKEVALKNSVVKLVINKDDEVLYFSRALIPCHREEDIALLYLKHIGLYIFTYEAINKISKQAISDLEKIEKLEQLTWLNEGMKIKAFEYIGDEFLSVDTPEDLEFVRRFVNEDYKRDFRRRD